MNQQQAHELCPEHPENPPYRSANREIPETDPRREPANWEAYSLEILTALLDA